MEAVTHDSPRQETDGKAGADNSIAITNCHIHTFTRRHTPSRFVPIPINWLATGVARVRVLRKGLLAATRLRDPRRRGRLTRFVEIINTSALGGQRAIFDQVSSFYPSGTRFVVLPMDMTLMGAGGVEQGIREQHDHLAAVRDGLAREGRDVMVPFVAVDPRHVGAEDEHNRFDVVNETIERIAGPQHFGGIKLYPPTGYHPDDDRLKKLYEFADKYRVPVISHCSRPAQVQYHGRVTSQMRRRPGGGDPLKGSRYHLLSTFTNPDAYKRILTEHKNIPLCLAHFGGAGDWDRYIQRPQHGAPAREPVSWWMRPLAWARLVTPPLEDGSWLLKILEMIRSENYPNLWTDISYTLFADDDYIYLLKVLLEEPKVRKRVLFGSDFYVVENAPLEERQRSIRIRAILGEDVFRQIAETNPGKFLDLDRAAIERDFASGELSL